MRLLFCLLLTGCCTPEFVEVPVEVQVPVPVPCIEEIPPHVPWATESLSEGATDGDMLRALLIEREQYQGYTARLVAILSGCQS